MAGHRDFRIPKTGLPRTGIYAFQILLTVLPHDGESNAKCELEGFPAPLSGVVPDLSFARNIAYETHSPALGLATTSARGSR
jgi:hypothetical protein